MSNFEDDFARGCLPTGEPLECLYGMGWWSELPEEKPAEPEPEPEPKASGGAGMNRWRAEYAVYGIWRFYRDGMELGLYEKGDVVIDALNNAESRIAELEDQLEDWTNNGWAEDYKARIAELEEKQRWIPVSKRLPEDGKPVWVCTIWNEQHSGFLIDGVWGGLFRDFREGEITHWLPLPPNPESPNDTQSSTIVYGKESEE
ncbi:MAG: DUF551 domain-containing protein [Bacteroidales bacterium]